jgi:hypothetical protein
MTDQPAPIKLPHLREHDFHSATPVIGPLISRVRRGLYSITAKWAVRSLIEQQNQVINLQNQINTLTARRFKEQDQYLHDLDERLIAQDRDLTRLARALAEIEIRQHYLLKSLDAPVPHIESHET